MNVSMRKSKITESSDFSVNLNTSQSGEREAKSIDFLLGFKYIVMEVVNMTVKYVRTEVI